MLEKGHNRDAQQYHIKIKELRQAYQKTREANSQSGSSPKTCHFFEELHALLSGDPTIVPPHSIDTSKEYLSRTNEEDSVDEESRVQESGSETAAWKVAEPQLTDIAKTSTGRHTMFTHNKLKIFVMLLSLATYTAMVVLNAGAGSGRVKGVFLNTVGNISTKYNTDFTPAGWTFLIWNVIYAWQFVWLGYALSGICRRNELGWVYTEPDVLPMSFYLVWILNNAINVGWLFLWDREYLILALVFLAVLTFTSYVALFISHRSLSIHANWFLKRHKAELWLIRILVQNGIALYATWTTIATLLNFTVVLVFNGNVSNKIATTTSLCILTFELVIWFSLENFVFDKYVQYTLTVYPVVIVALTGSVWKNYSPSSPTDNSVFTVVLLAVACVTFAVWLSIVIWRHCKRPLDFSDSPATTL
ncbi:uncharacterized protein [Emydura macquarii macquarii]|uniref:uncharacterized protein n=1 Tax=Emydura macquarii macquarii TaxID=1129001 RepID=UPI00352A7697